MFALDPNLGEPSWPIVGHGRAVELLRRSLQRAKLSHAYLFTGPPGTGKQTLAVAFAMAINCEVVPTEGPGAGTPCGLCSNCSRIRRGQHPDVTTVNLETQAQAAAQSGGKKSPPAKELKIETIRGMQSGLGLRPHSARRKVYIIGDAERMNEEAANCLLKSLEEPPGHSVLILLASDESQVLPTISSRCIQVPLRTVRRDVIARHLQQTLNLESERAELLAALSGGRVGVALDLGSDPGALDLRSRSLNELTLLQGAVITERLDASARLAKMFTDARPELYALLDTWEGWWRDVLVTSASAGELSENVDQGQALRSQSGKIGPERAALAIELIGQTRLQLQENVNPRLALEALTLGLP